MCVGIFLKLLRNPTGGGVGVDRGDDDGPRVYSHHINLHHFNLALLFYFAFTSYFASLYQKYQKYYIYQISLS